MIATPTLIAAHRFGLGPRPGDLATIRPDPRHWLASQLHANPQAPGFTAATLALGMQIQVRQLAQSNRAEEAEALQRELRGIYARDALQRFLHGVDSDAPFLERLVHFWTNHFAISTDKPQTQTLGGSFEAEAIRPHVLGSFADLLLASTRHPGMLLYLDNAQSVGPGSPAGRRSGRGLNENLAREILELHTLGVDGGYSQADVTAFARVLTGWTVANGPLAQRAGAPQGSFVFVDQLHEPANQRLLGKTYRQSGEEQGLAVLRDLAVHPATARHVATKLARHFMADDPPQEAVDRLSGVFLETAGHLPSLYQALIDEPAAWSETYAKYRTPNEWLLAIYRATGVSVQPNQLRLSLNSLAHPTWRPGSPAGWPDISSYWDSPDALGKRIEWANVFAQRMAGNLAATRLNANLFGEEVDAEIDQAVRRAESNAQGLVLALMSPALLRR